MPHDTGETPALLWGQCRDAPRIDRSQLPAIRERPTHDERHALRQKCVSDGTRRAREISGATECGQSRRATRPVWPEKAVTRSLPRATWRVPHNSGVLWLDTALPFDTRNKAASSRRTPKHHICSITSMPTRFRPRFITSAVRRQSCRRDERIGSADWITGQLS